MSLHARDIEFAYPGGPCVLTGCSLTIATGEWLACRGPSGSGKSTLAKILTGYLRPQAGEVLIDDRFSETDADLARHVSRALPVQLIWQHPEEALDPRLRLWRSIAEGLAACVPRASRGHLMSRRADVIARLLESGVLERLAIRDAWLERLPHELSGGELMRCCMARALLAHPRYLVCDEVTAMVDAYTQAQLWHALLEMTAERAMGVMVITHSRDLARRLCEHEVILDACSNRLSDTLESMSRCFSDAGYAELR